MKKNISYVPAALSLLAFAVFMAAFIGQFDAFREAVETWAKRDLKARAELAAATLEEPLKTDDFRKIREFADLCGRDGVSLSVFSDLGGTVYDSLSKGNENEYIFESVERSSRRIRAGITKERVSRPFNRAVAGFVLAALAGAAAVMLFFVVTYRQRVRIGELTRLEKYRRDFIADISHELKTPLAGITAAAELLTSDIPLPEDAKRETLAMIGKEALRLDNLAKDILSLSGMERFPENIKKDFVDADVTETLRDCVKSFTPQAAQAGITLENLSEEPVTASCDPLMLYGAVSNLLANAIAHSGARTVSAAVRREGSDIVIEVRDDGKGIPAGIRERVFERFFRADSSRSAETGGSGLGLAIVRQTARLHGGDARCDAVRPHGSVFSIAFPG